MFLELRVDNFPGLYFVIILKELLASCKKRHETGSRKSSDSNTTTASTTTSDKNMEPCPGAESSLSQRVCPCNLYISSATNNFGGNVGGKYAFYSER